MSPPLSAINEKLLCPSLDIKVTAQQQSKEMVHSLFWVALSVQKENRIDAFMG